MLDDSPVGPYLDLGEWPGCFDGSGGGEGTGVWIGAAGRGFDSGVEVASPINADTRGVRGSKRTVRTRRSCCSCTVRGNAAIGIDPIVCGIGPALYNEFRDLPFVVVFPQCGKGSNWQADGNDARRALEIVTDVPCGAETLCWRAGAVRLPVWFMIR